MTWRAMLAPGALLAACAAMGCGSGQDDERASTQSVSTGSYRPAAPATATTTTPATTDTTPTATTGVPPPSSTAPTGGSTVPDGESTPGGAGDEEPARTPAAFAITGTTASPGIVDVPAFLAVELRLTAADGKPHDVTLEGVADSDVAVAAGGTAVQRLDGLRPGTYRLLVDGARSGAAVRAG